MKYLRIWVIKSGVNNCSKMGFVPMTLTEVLSLTVSTRKGKKSKYFT